MNRNDTGQQSGRIRNLQNLKRGINIKKSIQLGLNEKKVNGMDTIRGVLHLSHSVWRGTFHCMRGYPIERGLCRVDMDVVMGLVMGMDIDEFHHLPRSAIDIKGMTTRDRKYL